MRDAKHIYLAAPGGRSGMVCECLERDSTLASVLPLLEGHGLVAAVARDCAVVAKRHDGSTIGKVALQLDDTVETAEARLSQALVRRWSRSSYRYEL